MAAQRKSSFIETEHAIIELERHRRRNVRLYAHPHGDAQHIEKSSFRSRSRLCSIRRVCVTLLLLLLVLLLSLMFIDIKK